VLKKSVLVITILYSLALAAVCLIKIDDLPKLEVSNADKIFHALSYVVLTFLWYATFHVCFRLKKTKALTYGAGISIIFGIIIEVLQAVFTTTRHSDIFDVFANSLGVLFTATVILLKNRITVKKL